MNAKWCLGRYLKILQIVTYQELQKWTKILSKKLDFKDIKLSVKARDIHKIEKRISIGISVFGFENKEKHPIYVSKKVCEEKNVDLLLIEEKGKRHYVLIKTLIHSCIIILLPLLFTSF